MKDLCAEFEKLGKGIGNANRYRILQVLMPGPATVSEIAEATKLPQPNVSQNLKVLKTSNLVVCSRRGKEMVYAIDVAYTTSLLHRFATDISQSKKPNKKKRSI